MAVITLTTEWRSDDFYNGIIRGKLCTLCPGTTIVENASCLSPFDISHGSFIIRNTFINYPAGSVHIICILSEARKGAGHLIVKSKGHYFIGTDNGIFSLILNSEPDEIISIDAGETTDELEVFARAAAGLVSGKKPSELGAPIKKINETLPLMATIDADVIIGSILFIDSYGNAISNITREIFTRVFGNRDFRIYIVSNLNFTDTISLNYNDVPVGDLLARFNSLDLLEFSINGANISELLSIEPGSSVRIDVSGKTAPANRLF